MNYSSAETIVIKNRLRQNDPVIIGGNNETRLGVLLGITPGQTDIKKELAKAKLCNKFPVSTFTDLSTDGNNSLRKKLISDSPQAVGTVPVYEYYESFKTGRKSPEVILDQLFATLEKQAKEGVDFFSIQASLDRSLLERLPNAQKQIPITSRGGAMLAEQMKRYDIENPYITLFPAIMDLCSHYGITLSLVGALRPGTVVDAFNELHLEELGVQKQLVDLCRKKKVQVMVELINHVPLNGLHQYGELASRIFGGVPYGALGPTTTDIAVNYDDVVGAISAAQAVSMGTSWINVVTAAEHTYFPGIEQLERALKFYKIALHIGHISRFGYLEKDAALSKNRNLNNWSGIVANCMFPDETEMLINELAYKDGRACSLCDKQCPLVRMRSVLKP